MTQDMADLMVATYEGWLDAGKERDEAVLIVALGSGYSCEEVEEILGIDVSG